MRLTLATRRACWVLDLRVLLGSLLVLLIVGSGVHYWHGQQLQRIAVAILHQADRLADDGQEAKAARQLRRYLSIHPNDGAVRVRLAEAYERLSSHPAHRDEAVTAYYQAVGFFPHRRDLREHLGQLLLNVGHYTAALQQADLLLAADPDNPAGTRIRALALLGQSRIRGVLAEHDALAAVTEELQKFPSDLSLVRAFVGAQSEKLLSYRAAGERERTVHSVEETLQRLIAERPGDFEPYLLRFRFRIEFQGKDDGRDLEKALGLAPHHPQVLLTAAWDAQRRQDQHAAANFYRQVIVTSPGEVDAYLGLAATQHALGQTRDATNTLQQGLDATLPEDFDLNYLLACRWIDLNELDAAREVLQTLRVVTSQMSVEYDAERIPFCRAKVDLLSARLLLIEGNQRKAIDLLRGICNTSPRFNQMGRMLIGEACEILASIYEENRWWQRAAHVHELAISANPRNPEHQLAAARNWARAGFMEAAIRHCRRVLEDDPANMAAWTYLVDLVLHQQLQRTPQERDWQQWSHLLGEAERAEASGGSRSSWRLAALKIKGEFCKSSARDDEWLAKEMKQLLDRYPAEEDLLEEAFLVFAALKQLDVTESLAEKIQATQRPSVPWVNAIQLAVGGDWDQALQTLRKTSNTSENPVQSATLRFQTVAAELARRTGNLAAYTECIQDLQNPAALTLPAILTQVTWAADQGDVEAAARWQTILRDLDGEDGLDWKLLRAEQLVQQADGLSRALPAEVPAICNKLERSRPGWGRLLQLKARIAERQGDGSAAIRAYTEALKSDRPEVESLDRLLRLLGESHRFHEQDAALRQFGVLFHPVSLLGDYFRAKEEDFLLRISSTSEFSGESPDDPTVEGQLIRVWRLELADQTDEANDQLTVLRESSPAEARIWAAQLGLLARHGRIPEAEQVFKSMVEDRSLSAADRQDLLEFGQRLFGKSATPNAVVGAVPADPVPVASPVSSELVVTKVQKIPTADPESVNEPSDAPGMRGHIDWLLQLERWKDAGTWLERLESLDGDNWNNRILRGRWLLATASPAGFRDWLDDVLRKDVSRSPGSEEAIWLRGARFCDRLSQGELAEAYYRRAARHSHESHTRLIEWLAEHDQGAKALNECLALGTAQPTGASILLLANVLRQTEPGETQWPNILAVARAALQQNGQNSQLALHVSDIYSRAGHREEARRMLQALTQAQSDLFPAWERLALIAAEEPTTVKDALRYIQEALTTARADLPKLLETKAQILIELRQLAEGTSLLEKLAPGGESQDPRLHLHLAYAYLQLGREAESRREFDTFSHMDCPAWQLTSLDKRWRADLKRSLQEGSSRVPTSSDAAPLVPPVLGSSR